MISVLVINLSTRPDRREHMEAHGKDLEFEFRFVDAVNGYDPKATVDMGREIGAVTGRVRTRIDYAAFSSHRKCWKLMVDENIPMAVILEDDVLLADDFTRMLDPTWIPRDADIVKIETTKRYVEVHSLCFNTKIKRYLGLLAGKHMGAAGYVITLKAAQRLWEKTKVPADQIDQMLFTPSSWRELELTIYQVVPAPVVQGMYQGDFAAREWASSTVQPDREARGYSMQISETRLFESREVNILAKLMRAKSFLHAFKFVRSIVKNGAYKRIQFR